MPWHYTELFCRLHLEIDEKNVFLRVLNVRLSVSGSLFAMLKESP
jgi:hypothetical protein